MAGRQCAATDRGMRLIARGVTLREAAILTGLARSTLVRACQRAGIVLKRGRPPKPRADAPP